MKAVFNRDVELEIVTGFDKNEDPIFEQEVFRKGAQVEFDLIDHPEMFVVGRGLIPDEAHWNVQFGDGSMAMGLSRDWFDLV